MIAQLIPGAVSELAGPAGRVVGLAILGGGTAVPVALLYRWYTRERVPAGVTLLLSLSTVALYLNVKTALGQVVAGETDLLAANAVVFNVAALAGAGVVAPVGARVGDRLATDTFAVTGVAREIQGGVGGFVRSVGRGTVVSLPTDADDVGDIDGFDPVEPSVKAAIAGTTLVFPGRLTAAELQARIAARLKEEHGVGYVDVEVDADGAVTHLALGARIAGVGATLPPGTAAVAVRADPPFAASPGDVVQVWTTGGDPERVATAEIRASVGDVVTLACEERAARRLAGGEFRLLTLPAAPRPDREFASLLQAADETMGVVTVRADSGLVGLPLGALEATVAAVESEGSVEPIPSRSRVLAAGDTLYLVARPEDLRRFEVAAAGADPSSSGAADGEAGPDRADD